MAHSYSIHKILNYGWGDSEADSYRFYYEEFHYAGSLLFFVSLFSALVIGIVFYKSHKEYRHKLAVEADKKSRIEREINDVSQKLKADYNLLMSFESQQVDEAILYYNTFCKKIIAALESSDEKTDLKFEYCSFNNINTSNKVLLFSNRSSSYYFYPMGIVVRNSNNIYKYIPIDNSTISIKKGRVNKMKPLPCDVRPIQQFWLHSCRDGSPDLRYKYNTKTYIYEYGILSIAELILHVYRMNTAKDVVSAYNELFSFISQIKLQKHFDKMNALPKEKETTSNNIKENKEIIPKAEQLEEVNTATANQHIVIENPKTIEECFIDIIYKRGTDVLKNKNLVDIISLYKEVDILEYKGVLDEMVCNDFLYQFVEPEKQNDFTLYNLSTSFACQKKVNAQKSLFIIQALVKAIKKSNSKSY